VSVKLNDQIGPYFQSYKGVRQEDPCLLYYLTLWLIVLQGWY
jgi:hypothetical protein